MKNLMKAAIGAENFAKFVWRHSSSETIKSIPEVAELQKDTQERLVALRKSVTTTKKYAEKIDAAANNAMKDIVPLLDDPKTNAKKIAKLTKKDLGGTGEEARNLRNMYRTEIVSRINEYFESHGVDPDGSSFAFIRSMEEMKYKNSALVSGPKAHGKLWDAMTMIKYGDSKLNHKTIQRFQGVANRRKLAEDMKNGKQNVTFSSDGTVNFGGKTYNVKHFEVLIGAAMTKIGKNFLSEFVLENAIIENGQIIATMKNGCEGNFVFIDIEEAQVRKPFSKIIDCYEVFFNADGTPTGERVKVSNECDDDPVIVDGECIDCDDKFINERIGTSEEAWAEVGRREIETDKYKEVVSRILNDTLGENGMLEKMQYEPLIAGGVLPRLYSGAMSLLKKEYTGGGMSTEEFNIAREEIGNRFKSAEKVVENSKKIIGGLRGKNQELLTQDITVAIIAVILGAGVGIASGPVAGLLTAAMNLPVFNIRMRWLHSKAEEIPGINEISKKLLNGVAPSYTKAFAGYIKSLQNERLAGLNAMKFNNGEDSDLQNENLNSLAERKLSLIKDNLVMLGLLDESYVKNAKRAKRINFGLFEDWFSGKRTGMKKSRKVLEEYAEYIKTATDQEALNDFPKREKAEKALKEILDISVKEFNDDYDQNLSDAELGKEGNWNTLNFKIKGKNVSVNLEEICVLDKNGNPVINEKGEVQKRSSWNHNITIDGITYSQFATNDGVRSINTLSKKDKKVYDKMIKILQGKRLFKKKGIIGRLAMLKTFHWQATQMEDLQNENDKMQVDYRIAKQKFIQHCFSREKESSQENAESSSAYAKMVLLEELWNRPDEKVNAERIIHSNFKISGQNIISFLKEPYKNEIAKIKAWEDLYKDPNFIHELTTYDQSIKAKLKPGGVVYDKCGKVCNLTMEDVYYRLKNGERFYYDNLFKEKSFYMAINAQMLKGLIDKVKGSSSEELVPNKADTVRGVKRQLIRDGYTNPTNQQIINRMISEGAMPNGQYSLVGNELFVKKIVKGGFKWFPVSLNAYAKNVLIGLTTSLAGEAISDKFTRDTNNGINLNNKNYKQIGNSRYKASKSREITTNTSSNVSNVSYVNNVTNNIENNYYQIIINQLKSGKTPKEAINIVKAAEWESPMDKKSIIQEIQKIPSNSVVKVEKIKQNSNGKLELSEGAKCPECVAWVFDKAGHLATKYEKDFYAINNDSVQQFIKKAPSIKEFGQMLSHVMAYSLYPQDAQSVKSFLKLNKEYVYPESYENAMMILNQVPAHTKMKIVNGHTYRIQHTYSIVNGKRVYNSPVLKFEIAPQEDTLYQNITTKASNIRKSRENLNNTNINNVNLISSNTKTISSLNREISRINRMTNEEAKKALLSTTQSLRVVLLDKETGKEYNFYTDSEIQKSAIKNAFASNKFTFSRVEK